MPPAAASHLHLSRFDRVDELDWEEWREATDDGLLWGTPEFLRNVEGAFSGRVAYVSAATRDGRTVGAATCYLSEAETFEDFNPARLVGDVALHGEALPFLADEERASLSLETEEMNAALMPAAICSVPFGYVDGLWASSPDVRGVLMRAFADIGQEWNAQSKAVLYVDERDAPLRSLLARDGYLELLASANCVLAARSLEEYLGLVSTSRRAKVRKEIRRFEGSGISLAYVDFAAHVDAIAPLTALHLSRHGFGYDPEGERQILARIGATLGSRVGLILARRGGRIVAFLMYFHNARVLYPLRIAWDPDLTTKADYLYFNLGFYEMLRLASRLGCDEIHYGPTAYEAKVARGCVLRPLYCYFDVPPELRERAAKALGTYSAGRARYFAELRARARRELTSPGLLPVDASY